MRKTESDNSERSLDELLKKLGLHRTEFLDDAAKWWCDELKKHKRTSPVAPDPKDTSVSIQDLDKWKKNAKARLEKYYEIEFSNMSHVTRDDILPDGEFSRFENKVLDLKKLQAKAGLSHPHPCLWGEYGRGAIRAKKLDKAEKILKQTITWLSKSGCQMSLRDCVRYYSDYARCASLRGDATEAIARASRAMTMARNIDRDLEEKAYQKYSGIPWDYHPALTYAFFSSMDARISSGDWEKQKTLQDEFTYFWRKSQRELNTPKSWSPLLKITVVSDDLWVDRMNNYAGEIAKDLYVLMADNKYKAALRTTQLTWWEISPHLSILSKNAKLLKKVAAVAVIVGGVFLGTLFPSEKLNAALVNPEIDLSAPVAQVIKKIRDQDGDTGISKEVLDLAMKVEDDTPGITVGQVIKDVQNELKKFEEEEGDNFPLIVADGGSSVSGM